MPNRYDCTFTHCLRSTVWRKLLPAACVTSLLLLTSSQCDNQVICFGSHKVLVLGVASKLHSTCSALLKCLASIVTAMSPPLSALSDFLSCLSYILVVRDVYQPLATPRCPSVILVGQFVCAWISFWKSRQECLNSNAIQPREGHLNKREICP